MKFVLKLFRCIVIQKYSLLIFLKWTWFWKVHRAYLRTGVLSKFSLAVHQFEIGYQVLFNSSSVLAKYSNYVLMKIRTILIIKYPLNINQSVINQSVLLNSYLQFWLILCLAHVQRILRLRQTSIILLMNKSPLLCRITVVLAVDSFASGRVNKLSYRDLVFNWYFHLFYILIQFFYYCFDYIISLVLFYNLLKKLQIVNLETSRLFFYIPR